MTVISQQVAQIRRDLELLKKNQVVISDTQPREPSIRNIWRDGGVSKWFDGKNWKADETSGGVLEFSTNVVFSSSSRVNVTWSAGVLNLGTKTGVGTHAIDA